MQNSFTKSKKTALNFDKQMGGKIKAESNIEHMLSPANIQTKNMENYLEKELNDETLTTADLSVPLDSIGLSRDGTNTPDELNVSEVTRAVAGASSVSEEELAKIILTLSNAKLPSSPRRKDKDDTNKQFDRLSRIEESNDSVINEKEQIANTAARKNNKDSLKNRKMPDGKLAENPQGKYSNSVRQDQTISSKSKTALRQSSFLSQMDSGIGKGARYDSYKREQVSSGRRLETNTGRPDKLLDSAMVNSIMEQQKDSLPSKNLIMEKRKGPVVSKNSSMEKRLESGAKNSGLQKSKESKICKSNSLEKSLASKSGSIEKLSGKPVSSARKDPLCPMVLGPRRKNSIEKHGDIPSQEVQSMKQNMRESSNSKEGTEDQTFTSRKDKTLQKRTSVSKSKIPHSKTSVSPERKNLAHGKFQQSDNKKKEIKEEGKMHNRSAKRTTDSATPEQAIKYIPKEIDRLSEIKEPSHWGSPRPSLMLPSQVDGDNFQDAIRNETEKSLNEGSKSIGEQVLNKEQNKKEHVAHIAAIAENLRRQAEGNVTPVESVIKEAGQPPVKRMSSTPCYPGESVSILPSHESVSHISPRDVFQETGQIFENSALTQENCPNNIAENNYFYSKTGQQETQWLNNKDKEKNMEKKDRTVEEKKYGKPMLYKEKCLDGLPFANDYLTTKIPSIELPSKNTSKEYKEDKTVGKNYDIPVSVNTPFGIRPGISTGETPSMFGLSTGPLGATTMDSNMAASLGPRFDFTQTIDLLHNGGFKNPHKHSTPVVAGLHVLTPGTNMGGSPGIDGQFWGQKLAMSTIPEDTSPRDKGKSWMEFHICPE